MAYETGTASNVLDILDKIRIVALARGWTVNYNGELATGNYKKWLSLQKGDSYWNLLSDTAAGYTFTGGGTPSYIFGLQATGYSAIASWTEQPGSNGFGLSPENTQSYGKYHNSTIASGLAGPFISYHIFSGENYIHMAIETTPDTFSFICLGILNKRGTYTGGSYLSMSAWEENGYASDRPLYGGSCIFDATGTYVPLAPSLYTPRTTPIILRAVVDGKTWFHAVGLTPERCTGLNRYFEYGIDSHITNPNNIGIRNTPNTFNGLAPLLSSALYISRTDTNLYSPAGEVPDFRSVNITNYVAKQEVVYGADTWVIFPSKKKGFTTPQNPKGPVSSGVFGHAFKKVL